MPHIVLNGDGSAEDYFLSRRSSGQVTQREPCAVALSGFRLKQFYYSSFAAAGFPKSIIYKRRPYLAHTLIAAASWA